MRDDSDRAADAEAERLRAITRAPEPAQPTTIAPPRLEVRELGPDAHGRRLVVEVLEHEDGERVARVRSRGAPLSPSIVVRKGSIDGLIDALTKARAELERNA